MITLTDKGAEKVHEFLDSQQADVSLAGLRVGVRGGGCSGFQYQLAFDEQRAGDVVFESHGLKLLIDAESLPFVRGSTIGSGEKNGVSIDPTRWISTGTSALAAADTMPSARRPPSASSRS